MQKRLEEYEEQAKQNPLSGAAPSARFLIATMIQNLESYARYYSSLTDEDLGRLSQDVQSLVPDARTALKAEMERRQLSIASVEWSAQPAATEPRKTFGEGFWRFLRNFLIFAGCDAAYVLIVGTLALMVKGIDFEAVIRTLTTALLKFSVALGLITSWRNFKIKTLWIIGIVAPAVLLIAVLFFGLHHRKT